MADYKLTAPGIKTPLVILDSIRSEFA